MTEQWRYACPHCGSRQIRQQGFSVQEKTGRGYVCCYRRCPERMVSPVDLKAD